MDGDGDSGPCRMASWRNKFACAISGAFWAFRSQNSFWVHILITIMVILLAVVLKIEAWKWVAVIFATTLVFAAELLNTSIEQLVKVLHPEQHPGIGKALDTAAAGVLVAALGAVAIGLITLGPPLLTWILE